MFQEINRTAFPPKEKPIMIWDGECNFCKYWITVWKCQTGEDLLYETYQRSADSFPDIPKTAFIRAIRLINVDGCVYGGADAAYRSMLYYHHPVVFWHKLYKRVWLFRKISDYGYKLVSSHRPFMLTVTKMMWGSNPYDRKSYWLAYLIILVIALLMFLF